MRRGRRWRRLAATGVLAALAAVSVVLALAWWQTSRDPLWWAPASALPVDEERIAEALEQGVSAAIYADRATGEPWTVELRATDAGAWLKCRLPRWLANRGAAWPASVGTPRVWIDRGWVGVGVPFIDARGKAGRVVSIEAEPIVEPGGALRLKGVRAAIGRLGLPGGRAASTLGGLVPRDMAGESALRSLAALLGEGGGVVLEDASFRLEDGRRIRLRAIELGPGTVRLTCVQEAAAR